MSEQKLNKICKILMTITAVLLVIFLYIMTITIISVTNNKMDYVDAPKSDKVYYIEKLLDDYNTDKHQPLENVEIKKLVDKNVDLKCYMLFYKDIKPDNTYGRAFPVFRSIYIDTSLKTHRYAIVLTHEMIHIKHLTVNEMYTQYQTFLYLFESDNEYLKECGVYFAYTVLAG